MHRLVLPVLLAALLVFQGGLALANDTMPPSFYAYRQLEDPAQEEKAQALMETLRCLVCQGQSIADSDASMAGDMRHQVRLRISQGQTPEQVRAWLIERYGEWVSYDPPLGGATLILWLLPLLLVALGLWFAVPLFRGQRKQGDPAEPG